MSSVCKCVHVCARACLCVCVCACVYACVSALEYLWLLFRYFTLTSAAVGDVCQKRTNMLCAALHAQPLASSPSLAHYHTIPYRPPPSPPLSYASALKAAVVAKASQAKRDLPPASVAVVVRLTKHQQGSGRRGINRERMSKRERERERVCSRGEGRGAGATAVWVGEARRETAASSASFMFVTLRAFAADN